MNTEWVSGSGLRLHGRRVPTYHIHKSLARRLLLLYRLLCSGYNRWSSFNPIHNRGSGLSLYIVLGGCPQKYLLKFDIDRPDRCNRLVCVQILSGRSVRQAGIGTCKPHVLSPSAKGFQARSSGRWVIGGGHAGYRHTAPGGVGVVVRPRVPRRRSPRPRLPRRLRPPRRAPLPAG